MEPRLLRAARLVSERALPLGRDDQLRVATEVKGEWKELRVALVEMSYRLELVDVDANGDTKHTPMSLLCYELRSKGDRPYTWAMWSSCGLGRFRLLSDRNANNLLAWVSGRDVFVTTVSGVRDRIEELTHVLSREVRPPHHDAPGVQRVPVGILVPEVTSWGVNALFFDISVLSVTKDDRGDMTVQISGPDSKRAYTLVRHEGIWRRD